MVTLIVCAEGPGLTLYSIDALDLIVSRPDECVLIISADECVLIISGTKIRTFSLLSDKIIPQPRM